MKKLQLKKDVIASLEKSAMQTIKGGSIVDPNNSKIRCIGDSVITCNDTKLLSDCQCPSMVGHSCPVQKSYCGDICHVSDLC